MKDRRQNSVVGKDENYCRGALVDNFQIQQITATVIQRASNFITIKSYFYICMTQHVKLSYHFFSFQLLWLLKKSREESRCTNCIRKTFHFTRSSHTKVQDQLHYMIRDPFLRILSTPISQNFEIELLNIKTRSWPNFYQTPMIILL